MHAEWDKVERSVVQNALAFTEQSIRRQLCNALSKRRAFILELRSSAKEEFGPNSALGAYVGANAVLAQHWMDQVDWERSAR
jgi:hypothetical protein